MLLGMCRCDPGRWPSMGTSETLHVKTHERLWIWHSFCLTRELDAAGDTGHGRGSKWQEAGQGGSAACNSLTRHQSAEGCTDPVWIHSPYTKIHMLTFFHQVQDMRIFHGFPKPPPWAGCFSFKTLNLLYGKNLFWILAGLSAILADFFRHMLG